MIFSMRKRKLTYWVVQFFAWALICLIIGLANFMQNGYSLKILVILFEIFILFILSSHFIRETYIRKDWFSLKISKIIINSLLLIFALSASWLIVFNILNWFLFEQEKSLLNYLLNGAFVLNIILYSIFLILWTAVYIANHLFRKSHLQELSNLKLQKSRSQYELKVLRDQLNPHFLFNSLNNIRALIEINPEHAKTAITTLSSLLRSSLLLGKKTYILLQEELKLADEYLKLEKIRFEERLNYKFDNKLQGDELIYVPPFIIQGMIENAVKHGISASSNPGEISISISFEKDRLLIEVENDGEYADNGKGIGLLNTRRRLEILYKKDAGFEIKNVNGKVTALVWIDRKHLNKNGK